jgi:hypothetical protein
MYIVLFMGLLMLAGIRNPAQHVKAAQEGTATATVAPGLLFGANSGGDGTLPSNFYSIDPATGAATLIGPIGFRAVSAMDFHPRTGVLYATGRRVSGSLLVLITINPLTGAGTEIGPLDSGFNVQDMSFRNSDAVLFAYHLGSLLTLNLTTGAATVIGQVNGFPEGNGIAFSPLDTLYYANERILGTINPATGMLTTVAPLHFPAGLGSFPRVAAMDFKPATSTLFGTVITDSNATYLTTINPATGDVIKIGQTIHRLDALAWSPTPFDMCIQDDVHETFLSFSSSTGEYMFVDCRKGTSLSGVGLVSSSACKLSLTDSGPDRKRPDRRVSALVNTCTHAAEAVVQFLPSGTSFTIHDSDTTNSACICH